MWSGVILPIDAINGLNFSMLCNWKLLTSIIFTVSLSELKISHSIPTPIFPTTFDLIFAVLKISPTKLVVVVLPLVPIYTDLELEYTLFPERKMYGHAILLHRKPVLSPVFPSFLQASRFPDRPGASLAERPPEQTEILLSDEAYSGLEKILLL